LALRLAGALPLGPPAWSAASLGLFGIAAAALIASVVAVAALPRLRQAMHAQLHALGYARALFPRSQRAALTFIAVALTAGFAEELVFRGLIPHWVGALGRGPAAAAAVSIFGFGLGHLYQGWRGILLTSVIGALMYLLTAQTGSLWPAMVLHAMVDLRLAAFYWFARP
jgi:membrane protease YdiL (CAAX protease family)